MRNKVAKQRDQIGRNFAIWAIFYGVGQIYFQKKSPNDLGKILTMKKSPQFDLNKAKILFQKRFFTCLSKIFKKFYLLSYVKKNYKRMSSAIGYLKQFYIVNLTKTWLGDFFGQFFIVFGRFFHKNIWSPCGQGEQIRHSVLSFVKLNAVCRDNLNVFMLSDVSTNEHQK